MTKEQSIKSQRYNGPAQFTGINEVHALRKTDTSLSLSRIDSKERHVSTRFSRCSWVSSWGTHLPCFRIFPNAHNLSKMACWVMPNFSASCCYVCAESWSSSSCNSASLTVWGLPERDLSLKWKSPFLNFRNHLRHVLSSTTLLP